LEQLRLQSIRWKSKRAKALPHAHLSDVQALAVPEHGRNSFLPFSDRTSKIGRNMTISAPVLALKSRAPVF
jgi:hypothetical protein